MADWCAQMPAAVQFAAVTALIEGEDSGPPTPFDFEAFLGGKRAGAPRAR